MLESIQSLYKEMRYDSLTLLLRPLFLSEMTSQNAELALAYGVHLAQTYQLRGMPDSAKYILRKISESLLMDGNSLSRANVVDFISGDLALKSEQDYTAAFEHYKKGYENSKRHSDIHGMGVALSNIVYVFYILADEYGMRYAQELYRLSLLEGVDYFTKQNAYIALAQMYYVQQEPLESYKYLCKADSIAREHDIHFYSALVSMIYGDIYKFSERYGEADSCYSVAMVQAHEGEILLIPLIYLNHGELFRQRGDYRSAEVYYKKGIEATYLYSNVEVRHKLLRQLTDLYYDAGETDSSLVYYMRLRDGTGTEPRSIPEADFNNLLLEYQEMEYEHELQAGELRLAKANQRIAIAVSAAAVVGILLLFLWIMYRRKQKMYRTLVMQYQKSLDKPSESLPQGVDAQLFNRIENVMQESRAYCRKDLSLDTLAEMVGSNRAYVSRTVNAMSGMPFPVYVNKYRVREAVRIMTADKDVLFKQLAEDLGYSSQSAFTKAFQSETGCTPTQYRRTLAGLQ